jgi:hypothetical protein
MNVRSGCHVGLLPGGKWISTSIKEQLYGLIGTSITILSIQNKNASSHLSPCFPRFKVFFSNPHSFLLSSRSFPLPTLTFGIRGTISQRMNFSSLLLAELAACEKRLIACIEGVPAKCSVNCQNAFDGFTAPATNDKMSSTKPSLTTSTTIYGAPVFDQYCDADLGDNAMELVQRGPVDIERIDLRSGALAGCYGEQSARGHTPSSFNDDFGASLDSVANSSVHGGHGSVLPHLTSICAGTSRIPVPDDRRLDCAEDFDTNHLDKGFESDPVPLPVVYDRYDEPNHNEIVEVLALLEYNEEARITDAIKGLIREATGRTAALEPVEHCRRQVLTAAGEVEQEPTEGIINEVEAEEACELPGDATDFSDPEDTPTSPPSRPSPTRSSTATSSTTHRSPGRKSRFHARCTSHPTTTARLLHSLPSPNQAEVVESFELESARPPVVYNSHVELGLYSFTPTIFSVEQVIEEEVPVAMPTRCSRMDLNRDAYSVLDLPVVCIVGGPNSNKYGTNRVLHYTISLPDFSQELRGFQAIAYYQAIINNLDDAQEQMDMAIAMVLRKSKQVYVSVSYNMADLFHSHSCSGRWDSVLHKPPWPPPVQPVQFVIPGDGAQDWIPPWPSFSGEIEQLELMVLIELGSSPTFFSDRLSPQLSGVQIVGLMVKVANVVELRLLSVTSQQYAYATLPPSCTEEFDATHLNKAKILLNIMGIIIQLNYRRIFVHDGQPLESKPNEPLRIQKMMTGDSVMMDETGDSWFNCHKIKLPADCGYEFQMKYGLIGWSMGALLGYAQGANHKLFSPLTALHPLVVACCDHGSIMDALTTNFMSNNLVQLCGCLLSVAANKGNFSAFPWDPGDDGAVILGVLGCSSYPIKTKWLNYHQKCYRLLSKVAPPPLGSRHTGCVVNAQRGGDQAWMQPLVHDLGQLNGHQQREIQVSSIISDPISATLWKTVEQTNSSHSFTTGLAQSVGFKQPWPPPMEFVWTVHGLRQLGDHGQRLGGKPHFKRWGMLGVAAMWGYCQGASGFLHL